MRRLVVLAAAIVAIVAIAACSNREPAGPRLLGLVPQADSVEGTGSETELLRMKAKWASVRDGRDYSFVTWSYCFCPPEVATPVRVSVRGASVVSVREVATGRSRSSEHYYTIEELYDRAVLERARDGVVRVSYSAASGLPLWLTVGTPENDAGVTYRVQDVSLE